MTTEHVMLRHDDRAQPPARPRRWMPAVAAAAIVVLAALPFALGGGDEFAGMSDAEIAAAFLAGEVDTPSELFSPDAVVEHRFLPTGDVDGWYAWRGAVGETTSDIHCVGEGDVACTFAFQLEAAATQGLGPYEFNSATFTFVDGQITHWADLTNPNQAARDVWNPFFAWLAPELHDQMYRLTESGQVQPSFTAEAIGLWEAQMDAFVVEISR